MPNELTTTTTTALPIASMSDLATAGTLIAQSGMMGVKTAADGFLVAATCHQERMSFLKFMEKYNVIKGRVSMKAEAMLSNLLELGGEYEVLERTPDCAKLKLRYKKAEYISVITWEDAQTESYVYASDGKTLKDNWSTPRRRSQMLWARAVSDGVRVVCPLATRGSYTPEEVQDFDDSEQPKSKTMCFDKVSQQIKPINRNVEICNIPNCPMSGKRWDSMPNEILEQALQIQNSETFGDSEKSYIQNVIEFRQKLKEADAEAEKQLEEQEIN